MISANTMVKRLRAYISAQHGTQANAAAYWGVSPAFVSVVLKGEKTPPAQMLNSIGLEKVKTVAYVQK